MVGEHVSRVSVEEVRGRRGQGERILLVDVRSRVGYEQSHIPGGLSLPLEEIASRYHEVPRGQTIVTY